jgi:hypothetical protein
MPAAAAAPASMAPGTPAAPSTAPRELHDPSPEQALDFSEDARDDALGSEGRGAHTPCPVSDNSPDAPQPAGRRRLPPSPGPASELRYGCRRAAVTAALKIDGDYFTV